MSKPFYHQNEGASLIAPRVVSTENQFLEKKNIAEITASTIVEGTTWTSALEDLSSQDFLDQEAATCSSVKRAGQFKSCKVESFDRIMTGSGPKTAAIMNLEHETSTTEPAEAIKEILDNYNNNVGGLRPKLLKKDASGPLTETDLPYIPKQSIAKLFASTDIDFIDLKPEHQIKESIEFQEASDEICNRLNQGGQLFSCVVESLSTDADGQVANVEFEFESNSAQEDEITQLFAQEYDEERGLPIKDLDVKSVRKNPKAPHVPSNLAKITASTIDETTTWRPTLDDPRSQDFHDQEALTCSSVKRAGHFKSCKVESFEEKMTPSGPKTVATLNLDYETTTAEPVEAIREVLDNYDSSGPTLLKEDASGPLTETDLPYMPKKAIAKLSASTDIDFLDLKPEHQIKDSIEFKEASDEICERLYQGGRLLSCTVESLSTDADSPVANIELEIETNSAKTQDIIEIFQHEYDEEKGLPIRDLEVNSVKRNPVAPSVPQNVAKITVSTIDENTTWRSTLDDPSSQDFLDQEAVTCSAVKRAGQFQSCKVKNFQQMMTLSGLKTVATLNLDHKTTTAESADAMKEILDNYDSSGPPLLKKHAYGPLSSYTRLDDDFLF